MRFPWRRPPTFAQPRRFGVHVWGNDADWWNAEIVTLLTDGTWTFSAGCWGWWASYEAACAAGRQVLDEDIEKGRRRAEGVARSANRITYEAQA